MKSDEQRLNRKLLDKIKMDREREQRILAMHRQAQILEEEIIRDRKKQKQPLIDYDPLINIKPERRDDRQLIVDDRQIERNNNQQDEHNQLRSQVKSQEDERVLMLENKQRQLLRKV